MTRANISVTADAVILRVRDDQLQVLLVKRTKPPFEGQWAIPGGFVEEKESLADAARRELKEETGIDVMYLEQLYAFGDVGRDPRGRVVTIAYFKVIDSDPDLSHDDEVSEVRWFPVYKTPQLAFDHKIILEHAITRYAVRTAQVRMEKS